MRWFHRVWLLLLPQLFRVDGFVSRGSDYQHAITQVTPTTTNPLSSPARPYSTTTPNPVSKRRNVQSTRRFFAPTTRKHDWVHESGRHGKTCNFGSATRRTSFTPVAGSAVSRDDNSTTKIKPKNASDHLTKESKRLSGLRRTIKVGKVWDIYMEELIKYNQTHGHINVPGASKEYPQLAEFVLHIRRYQKRLTLEQRDTLDNLGFVWNGAKTAKERQNWLAMLERLQQYKNEFGDCIVPQNYIGGQRPSLGKWVSSQRTFYRKEILAKDRLEMLNSTGFVWKIKEGGGAPDDKIWEVRLQELMDFKRKYNHTNVPFKYKANVPLANWVKVQRNEFSWDTLRDDRSQKLEDIGFIWNFDKIRDSAWQQQFARLKQHVETYGRNAPIQDLSLSSFANKQRVHKDNGNLDKKRIAKLDMIGFNWEPNKKTRNKPEDLVRNEQNSSIRKQQVTDMSHQT